MTGVLAYHQSKLEQGEFLIQRCTACGKHVYYPRELCPHCGSTSLEWKAPGGGGVVHAVTTVRRKPADGGDINVSLVDLDEGVRLMSRVDNLAPDAVKIGQRVKAKVVNSLVVFDAVDGGAA